MGSSRWFPLRRLRSALALDRDELLLSLQAIGDLVVARVAIATLGFARIRGALESTRPGRPRTSGYPMAVRRAVARAARTVPGSRCLPQAIVAFRLLRRGAHPAEFTLGVRRRDGAGAPLHAHAWVRSGALIVTGDSGDTDIAHYTTLAHIRNGP